jgi:hypothetical protein
VPRQTENFIKSWNAEHQASQGSWLKRFGKTGGLEKTKNDDNNDHDNDNDNNKPDYSYTKILIV